MTTPNTELLPISCFIRTMNSSRLLDDVLGQAAKVASEIVVVDSGSTDETLDIAARYGAKIVKQPWLGNGFQKRIGEENCTNDWLLDLDSDEVMSGELVDEIRQLFIANDNRPPFDIYRMHLEMRDPTGRNWGWAGLVYRFRVYRKSVARAPESGAWDQFDLPDGVDFGILQHPLYHAPYADLDDLTAKQNRATTNRARGRKMRPMWQLKMRAYFFLPIYFAKIYLQRRLCLRGFYGFVYSVAVAHSRWMIDVKMYERAHNIGRWQEQPSVRQGTVNKAA